MDQHPTFLRSIEIHSKKPNQDQKQLLHSFQLILKEKHELETTHNKIVRKSVVPIKPKSEPDSRNLSRSKEFIRKKIHYINCPTVPKQSTKNLIQDSSRVSESEKQTEDEFSDLSFLTSKIPSASNTFQTSIFYAEDLFGNKKSSNTEKFFFNQRPRRTTRPNFNNPYTRHVAGSSACRTVKRSEEVSHDPLVTAEASLPSHMRTLSKDSPWVYSSVLRTQTICRVKCKSRG